MAIVNITRIQHRRGDYADLPQLASGELGWAIDTQQLFVGNGSLAEGAPYVGNTEILTEHSNLIATLGNYTFEGNSVGVNPIVGGVLRSINDKLDDTVSVRDFGADGTGAECSGAINQALTSLFTSNGDEQTRIGLYFPAGVYLINTPLEIPPNAYIFGDGMGNTVIRTGSSVPLVRTVDSQGQSGISMGSGLLVTESLPTNILIRDITFEKTVAGDLTDMRSTTDLVMERVEFVGIYTDQTSATNSTQTALVFTSPSSATASGNITATGCRFRQLGRALFHNDYLYGISFDRCLFLNSYNGIKIDNAANPPDPVVVQNCYFNSISREAIIALNGARFNSINNRYVDVGNRGTASSVDNVLYSESVGCTSWLDQFDRLVGDSVPRFVSLSGSNTNVSSTRAYADPEDRFKWGLKETLRSYVITLTGGTSGSLTDIEFTTNATGSNSNTYRQEVRYVLTRDTDVRTGVITVSATATGSDFSDTFTYVGTDCDVVFNSSVTAGVVSIDYTIGAGNDATMVLYPTNLLVE